MLMSFLLVGAIALMALWPGSENPPMLPRGDVLVERTRPASEVEYTSTEPTYVGREVCGECHSENYQLHSHHGHAHTFTTASDPEVVKKFAGKTYEAPGYGKYTYVADADGLFVQMPDLFGDQKFLLEYALGSGHHGVTLVTLMPHGENDTVLIEHRASWFPKGDHLGPTPGQQGGRPETVAECFGQPHEGIVMRRCIDCHTTTASIVDRKIVGLTENVNCEKCHGPGSLHVQQARESSTPPSFSVGRDDWDTESEIQLCGSCHRMPDTLSIKEFQAYPDLLTRFQPIGLLRSECYVHSDGSLKCTTCHNPHTTITASSTQDYVAECIKCHQQNSDQHTVCPVSPTSECIDCHMPPIQIDAQGTIFHDHWIRVRDRDEEASHDARVYAEKPVSNEKGSVVAAELSRDVLKQYEDAVTACESGDFETALQLIRVVRRAAPSDPKVLFLTAHILAEQNRFPEAVKMLDDLAITAPATRFQALGQTAEWRELEGKWRSAEQRYRILLDEMDDTSLVDRLLAQLLMREGRRLEAATFLQKLCRQGVVDESNLRLMLKLASPLRGEETKEGFEPIGALGHARYEMSQGNWDAALQQLSSRNSDPDQAALRGRVYAEKQDFAALANWAADLPENAEQSADFWFARGVHHAHQGDHGDAVRCFLEVVRRDQTDAEAYRRMGGSLQELGDQTKAEKASQRAEWIDRTQTIGNKMAAGGVPNEQEMATLISDLQELHRPYEALGWRAVKVYYGRLSGTISEQQSTNLLEEIKRERLDQINAADPEVDQDFVTCGIDVDSPSRVRTAF